MKEIIEIYTKSGTFNNISEIMKQVQEIRTKQELFNFEEMARYICERPNGRKILVELQVSSKAHRDLGLDDYICITSYEFEGDIKDYSAEEELDSVEFHGNWKTAIKQMKALAERY